MIPSIVRTCSSVGRLAQTRGALTSRMIGPPGDGHSLEGLNQFRNGGIAKNGWGATRLVGQVRAGNGNEAELTGDNLDLAVADMIRQTPNACQLESATDKRVSRIGHGHLAFAALLTDRCIRLDTVCRRPADRAKARRGTRE
jgi:hypothetical protein